MTEASIPAFEGLTRRVGVELAGVAGRPTLQDVITAFKDAGESKINSFMKCGKRSSPNFCTKACNAMSWIYSACRDVL
jgi:hypothetical protein